MNPIEQQSSQQVNPQLFAQSFLEACQKIGILQAIIYKFKSSNVLYRMLYQLGIYLNDQKFSLYVKGLKFPLYCRYGTTDRWVFEHIFVKKEYSEIGKIENVNLIIDCGAYVGYSAVYFLNKYPQARVIAIEPDPDNFELCSINLAPYGERVSLLKSAIWSSKVGLVIDRPERAWGIQVRPCQEGETPELNAIDMRSLLEEFRIDSVDILKVDIEKAEMEVFSCNYQEWLNKVNYIAIELHGKECEKVFFKALSSKKYDSWSAGELTFCKIHSSI